MAIVERERPLEGGFQTLLMKLEEIHTTVSFDEFLYGFIVNFLHGVFIIKLLEKLSNPLPEIMVKYQIYA